MKEKVQLFYNNIKRYLSNEELARKVYMYWALTCLVLIGFLGIYPLGKSLYSNIVLALDMNKTNLLLNKKIADLNKAEESITNAGNNLLFLDYFLPTKFDLQNYMIDYVFLSGRSGFIVDKFSPVGQEKNRVNLSVVFIGDGNITEFLENLESSNRISEVTNLRIVKGGEYTTTYMKISTFEMEKQ